MRKTWYFNNDVQLPFYVKVKINCKYKGKIGITEQRKLLKNGLMSKYCIGEVRRKAGRRKSKKHKNRTQD